MGVRGTKASVELREIRFAIAYCEKLNGYEAALAAGFKGRRDYVQKKAHYLIGKASVKELIRTHMDSLLEHANVTNQRIISELANIAFADIGGLYDKETGELLGMHQIDQGVRKCIAEAHEEHIDIGGETGGTIRKRKYKMNDKLKALKMLMDYKGLSRPDIEVPEAPAPIVIMNGYGSTAAAKAAIGIEEASDD